MRSLLVSCFVSLMLGVVGCGAQSGEPEAEAQASELTLVSRQSEVDKMIDLYSEDEWACVREQGRLRCVVQKSQPTRAIRRGDRISPDAELYLCTASNPKNLGSCDPPPIQPLTCILFPTDPGICWCTDLLDCLDLIARDYCSGAAYDCGSPGKPAACCPH